MATSEKTEHEVKELPKLVQEERLELQNIMLRMALERQRIEKYEVQIDNSKKEIDRLEDHLNLWNGRFSIKLKKDGYDINQVEIDAETGEIRPLNITQLVR